MNLNKSSEKNESKINELTFDAMFWSWSWWWSYKRQHKIKTLIINGLMVFNMIIKYEKISYWMKTSYKKEEQIKKWRN